MPYTWTNTFARGDKITNELFNEIRSVAEHVTATHCPSHNTGYDSVDVSVDSYDSSYDSYDGYDSGDNRSVDSHDSVDSQNSIDHYLAVDDHYSLDVDRGVNST